MSGRESSPETATVTTRFDRHRGDGSPDTGPGAVEPEIEPTSRIGPYRILGRLGKGGMATVYRAEDTRLGRVVALKFLPVDHDDARQAKSRFLREARAASKLDHPNICTVHEIGETEDGRLYIVMACYEGETLDKRLRRGPLPVEEAVWVARQVAAGLGKAHREGIVHRDVKPGNVFLTHDGQVKVLDFGIAKVVGDATLTNPEHMVGTIHYMAPEQMGGDSDHRADLWALGVLLYEMLTGERPFPGPNFTAVIQQVLNDPAPRLLEKRPEVPAEVRRVIERALAKDPARRYASAEEMLADLPGIEESSGSLLTTALGVPRRPQRRPRPVLWAAAALLVVAAVVGAFFLGSQGERDAAAAEAATLQPADLPSPVPAAAPSAVAVLPFAVRGAPAYDYLREGMMDLLSTKLDGAGAVRAVAPRTLLRQLATAPDGRGDDLAAGGDAARRVGADLLIHGTVVEIADQLRFDVALYKVAPDRLEQQGRAAAEGPATEIFGLVDALAIQLLTGMDRGAGARLRRLAAMTSESLPALKLYLEAESAWRGGRYGEAARALEGAVVADPEFALAWYRLSVVRGWVLDVEGAAAALAPALRHAERLAPDDRRLLEVAVALDRGDAVTAERLCREVLSRRPDDLEAWAALGEVDFHLGPLYGHTLSRSRRSWERVLELEPDNQQALLHLARLDLYEQDFAALDRRSARLLQVLAGSERVSEALLFRAMLPGADAERQSFRAYLAGSELGIPWLTASHTVGSSRAVVELWGSLYRMLLAPERPLRQQSFAHRHLGIFALATGRPGEADAHLARATHPPEQDQEHRALAATLPFLPVPEERLRQLIAAVEAWPVDRPARDFSPFEPHAGFPRHHRLYVLALLESRAGAPERALALADELAAAGEVAALPGLARDLEAGVRADVAWRAGRFGEVLALLDERHARYSYELPLMSPLFSLSRERFLKADALIHLGRQEEALAWLDSLSELSIFDLVYLPGSSLRRAEVYERLGRPAEAAGEYRRYLEWRAGCDDELQPEVERARQRLRALVPNG